jgi:hypothetical protein
MMYDPLSKSWSDRKSIAQISLEAEAVLRSERTFAATLRFGCVVGIRKPSST